MKVGIMGGTFDPIHTGHLLLGEFAFENFGLDEIWFMPNGSPPHKDRRYSERYLVHRVEMVKLATEANPHFKVNLSEAVTEAHSYTYKTLQRLRGEYPEHEFYFIMGADSLFEIEEWENFREIFPSCTLLAAPRDGRGEEEIEDRIRCLVQAYGAKIHLLKSPFIDISSTYIRDRARNGLSIRYMVPDRVGAYICDNGLYRD